MAALSFQSLGIFSQLHIITLILVICFVGSKQIGVPLTVNWFGTTIIANGPKWTLRIGMRKCMASLPSPHAVQAGNRCVFATESIIP